MKHGNPRISFLIPNTLIFESLRYEVMKSLGLHTITQQSFSKIKTIVMLNTPSQKGKKSSVRIYLRKQLPCGVRGVMFFCEPTLPITQRGRTALSLATDVEVKVLWRAGGVKLTCYCQNAFLKCLFWWKCTTSVILQIFRLVE